MVGNSASPKKYNLPRRNIAHTRWIRSPHKRYDLHKDMAASPENICPSTREI
jgi:hypothetical protein